MRFSITDLSGGHPDSAAIDVLLQRLDPRIESLLQPFLEQLAPARSMVAVGCHRLLGIARKGLPGEPPIGSRKEAALLRLFADGDSLPPIEVQQPIRPTGASSGHEDPYTLDNLARQARELAGAAPGNDLLLLPANLLDEMLTPLADEFSFRAVAAILPQAPGQVSDGNDWRLRRSLFDRGLVCIGSVQVAGRKTLCFLSSDAVRKLDRLDVQSRGHVSMQTLATGSRFANQMFRYSCGKLYALRHGLTAAFPEWDGRELFGLKDKSSEGLNLPRLTYVGFDETDREMWDQDDPPINIDLQGYFQEIPECWRKHRPLLRRLFELAPEHVHAIEAWRHDVTDGGRRTLVAIHVRRGDYRSLPVPQFRMVPAEWYLDWLRAIWPTLHEPLLFVATDEPDVILPVFREFEPVSPELGSAAEALPDYVRDFEILRRADYLSICNSSFGRMAAILAPDTQKSFLASFQTRSFEPYEPWIDPAFWARFADSGRGARLRGKLHGQPAPEKGKNALDAPVDQATIFFDVSDLLIYLLHQSTLSGIQRVECEILTNLLDIAPLQPVRFVFLNRRGGLYAIDTSALLDVIEDIQSDAMSRAGIEVQLRALLKHAVACTIRAGSIFLTLGAFWNVSGMGSFLQNLKNSGVTIGVFIHDIIPVSTPEYFEAASTRRFVKGVLEALTFADFIVTTSEYNKASLIEHMALWKLDPLPVHVVPLGHKFSLSAPIESRISSLVAAILDTDYVLCVGTIEVRKNPGYLFNIWKMMVRSGRPNPPYLVFAGRKGWLIQDFMDQLKACNFLGGNILVVHNATDVELELLYRNCVLTAFPSFAEGWGLPAGESLAQGKICLSSGAGGIPEVGGELLDYIDPYNARDGFEKLVQYLDDPELRGSREREIAGHFKPRSWSATANDFLRSTQALARQVRPFENVAAILLPSGRYLQISSEAAGIVMDGVPGMDEMGGTDGGRSAELICISGWHRPELSGVRAAEPATLIRFRPDAPVGTRINVVLRLAARGRDFRIRLCSGSGAETEVAVADGSEKVAVLPCTVEPGRLITAHLLLVGAMLDGDEFSGASYWTLKGIMYFDPKRVAREALTRMKGTPASQAPTMASPPPTVEPLDRPEHAPLLERIPLRYASVEDSRRVSSLGTFLQTTNCFWPSAFTTHRNPPIFADDADREAFYSGCGNSADAPRVGAIHDRVKLVRRSDQFVSTSRFSEGSVFDRVGVWKAMGYLEGAPPEHTPWLSNETGGLSVDEELLVTAPYYEGSYLIFYNGNLHNYYHWMVEGLLPLDVLSGALGLDSNVKIALPKTMDINALLDHRESVRVLGFNQHDVVEVDAKLIQVQEAIWVDSDVVQSMPAPYLRNFQQRIAAMYAHSRGHRNRRLLVARNWITRRIHNIQEVEACLAKHDFETVYLEGVSMLDQILLFQSAEFIISPHGAGLSNLLFCEPGTKVIEFMPSVQVREFFWLISEKLGLVHGMQFCEPIESPHFQSSINVDIDKLQVLMDMVDSHSRTRLQGLAYSSVG